MDYRNELKFVVSDLELETIRYRLMYLMQMDRHGNNGVYIIRSLYFDDIKDSCMADNEAGVGARSKYRMRLYDGNLNLIKLEKKSKKNNMTRKQIVSITAERGAQYLSNNCPSYKEDMPYLERELFSLERLYVMRPKVIVEYERTAFIESRGNVRITFDRNIRASTKVNTFFQPTITARPVLPRGYHVLEVKYDEFLPSYLQRVLDTHSLQRTSVSKYYLARCPKKIML